MQQHKKRERMERTSCAARPTCTAAVGLYAARAQKAAEDRSQQQQQRSDSNCPYDSQQVLAECALCYCAPLQRQAGSAVASGGRVSLVVKVGAGRGLVPVLGSHHQSGGSGGEVAPPGCRTAVARVSRKPYRWTAQLRL